VRHDEDTGSRHSRQAEDTGLSSRSLRIVDPARAVPELIGHFVLRHVLALIVVLTIVVATSLYVVHPPHLWEGAYARWLREE
jgi:hypothetical protein